MGSLHPAGRSGVSLHDPHCPSGLHCCLPQLHAIGVSHQRTAPGTHTHPGGPPLPASVRSPVPPSSPGLPLEPLLLEPPLFAHDVTSPVHALHEENSPVF